MVEKKLNAKLVEINAAHQHTANVPEFEFQKSTAKRKKKMASPLNQYDSVLRVDVTRTVLAKCTPEQVLKHMRKAPLDDMLQGKGDTVKTITYA